MRVSRIFLALFISAVGVATAADADAQRSVVERKLRGLAAAGDHEGLARLLQDWVDDHPEDVEAHLRLGQAYAEGGQPEGAERAWRRLLRHEPGQRELYRKVSGYARRAGLYDLAIDILLEGRRQVKQGRYLFAWQLSDLYMQAEDWPNAVESLLDYVEQVPNRYSLAENRLHALARGEGFGLGAEPGGNQDPGAQSGSRSDSRAGDGSVTDGAEAPWGSRSAGMLAALEVAASRARDESMGRGQRGNLEEADADRLGGPQGRDPLAASMLLSSFALELGQPQLGFSALSAVAHLPEAPAAVFQFASRCEAHGYDEVAATAYDLFNRSAGDSPYRHHSLLRQASIEERSGRYTAAVATYGLLAGRLPQQPEAAEALLRIGRLQLEALGDPAAARLALQALLSTSGAGSGARQPQAIALLAECDLRQDELARAAERLASLLTVETDETASVRLGLAEISYFRGDFDAAVAHLDSFLSRQPHHSLANDALELLLVIEDHQWQSEALAVLARAQLRERQARHPEAAADWQWLAENGSDELREHSLLAQAKLRQSEGALPQALELYEQMASRFPQGRHALESQLGRARVLEQRGDWVEALKAYEASVLHFPDDARAAQVRLHIQRLRQRTRPGRARG